MVKKVSTAWKVIGTRGFSGFIDLLAVRSRRLLPRRWVRNPPWLGALVRLRGNRVQIGDCTFDVAHPLISNAIRSRLARGRYERPELELIADWLDPDAPVIELGGGIGVVATLVNRMLRNPLEHVVVEANPSLIPVLHHHKALNRAGFVVEHAALDYSGSPTARLVHGKEFISGRVGTAGDEGVAVPVITLERLVQRFPWENATLVCDIEGLEIELVEREGELLARHCRTLIIELHPKLRTKAERDAMMSRLHALGFGHVASMKHVHAFRRSS